MMNCSGYRLFERGRAFRQPPPQPAVRAYGTESGLYVH
jgi:hypothetical protein